MCGRVRETPHAALARSEPRHFSLLLAPIVLQDFCPPSRWEELEIPRGRALESKGWFWPLALDAGDGWASVPNGRRRGDVQEARGRRPGGALCPGIALVALGRLSAGRAGERTVKLQILEGVACFVPLARVSSKMLVRGVRAGPSSRGSALRTLGLGLRRQHRGVRGTMSPPPDPSLERPWPRGFPNASVGGALGPAGALRSQPELPSLLVRRGSGGRAPPPGGSSSCAAWPPPQGRATRKGRVAAGRPIAHISKGRSAVRPRSSVVLSRPDCRRLGRHIILARLIILTRRKTNQQSARCTSMANPHCAGVSYMIFTSRWTMEGFCPRDRLDARRCPSIWTNAT